MFGMKNSASSKEQDDDDDGKVGSNQTTEKSSSGLRQRMLQLIKANSHRNRNDSWWLSSAALSG